MAEATPDVKHLLIKKIFLYLFLLLSAQASACINAYAVDVFGNYPRLSLSEVRDIRLHNYSGKVEEWRAFLEENFRKGHNGWEYLNEVAVCDIFTGDYIAAKKKLFRAIAIEGLNYRISANLGVLYELTGNNDSAYYYTKKAYELDHLSHNGSEWIHLKILEAEIKEAQSPGWLRTHQILNVDTALSIEQYNRMIYQLNFQLHERILLVKPQNIFVADLLITLGKLNELTYAYQSAVESYRLAGEYDPRIKACCDSMVAQAEIWSRGNYTKAMEARKMDDQLRRSARTAVAKLNTAKVIAAHARISSTTARLVALRHNRSLSPWLLIPVFVFALIAFVRRRKK
ncbi:MAG: tetratricopeptide repeat protein [Bacteroidetes bacterium]|nr:tetratricopeptide repeat protein [Bacteroidota bacterium]